MNDNLIKKKVMVEGMTCGACALKIESTLEGIEGVSDISVSYGDGFAHFTYDKNTVAIEDIAGAINRLGYHFEKQGSVEAFSEAVAKEANSKKKKIAGVVGIVIIALALYFVFNNIIGFNFLPEVNQSMSFGILFVVGLLTSVHCIAMCGGINLSQCVSKNSEQSESIKRKLKPSILYNAGRVISYTIIGGIVGAIGSVFSFSGEARAIVVIVAGTFMLLMGLTMLDVFPRIRKIIPRMPKFISKKIHGAKKGRGPLVVGLLNGFMPCGPLQAMQLYALGTGSFLAGAFSMFLFSIGTVPLMFAFGAISSILSSKFTKKMMWVSAALVIVLGVIMVGRGLNQSGISILSPGGEVSNIATVRGNTQLVSTNMQPNEYEPIAVQEGIPVKWTINVEEGDLNGCNNPVTIPKYGVEKKLEIGENIIEFTPTGQGKVLYTCWMGMIYGNIVVVSDISQVSEDDVNTRTYDEIELYGDGNETGSEEIIIDLPLCCYGLYDVEDYEGETDSEE